MATTPACPSLSAVVLGLLVAGSAPLVGAEAVTVRPLDADSGVFGGIEVVRRYGIEGPSGLSGSLGWSLIAHRRTLARGEAAFTIKPGGAVDVSIPLQVPPVREGVVLEAELTVSAFGGGVGGEAISHRRSLWIFPRDAFAGRTQWLEKLEVGLFDPRGETAAVFDAAGIPYRRVHRPQAIGAGSRLVVIGEGLAIEEHPGLAAAAFAAAERGTPVLWLAPAAGHFALPGAGGTAAVLPGALAFRDLGAIAEIDRRLDGEGGAGPDRAVAAMAVGSRHGEVVVEIAADAGGWPWFEVHYPPPGAGLIVCGLPLIARWEESPTPRFLLVRLFERLTVPHADPAPSAGASAER